MTLKNIFGIEQTDEEVLLKIKEARDLHKETIFLKQADGSEVSIKLFKNYSNTPDTGKAQGGH